MVMSEQAADHCQSAKDLRLLSLIGGRIVASDGALPFDKFMELALYHPLFGYYTSDRKRVGGEGDFITSVSIGRCFGMILAHHFAPILQQIAAEEGEVVLTELGAEGGDLACDLMGELSEIVPESVFERLSYVAVEPFDGKRDSLSERLADKGLQKWQIISGLDQLQNARGILFANEVLDAMPVKRVRWRGEKWLEICVGIEGEAKERKFIEVERPINCSSLLFAVKDFPEELSEGFTIEVNLKLEGLFGAMDAGFDVLHVCLIDYGFSSDDFFDPVRKSGTLRAYSGHEMMDSPLSNPGSCDLTAHVNFDHVSGIAERRGFDVSEMTDQHHFLVKAAEPWLREVERCGDLDSETSKLLRQFKLLFHPSVMGSAFKVMEMRKGYQSDSIR